MIPQTITLFETEWQYESATSAELSVRMTDKWNESVNVDSYLTQDFLLPVNSSQIGKFAEVLMEVLPEIYGTVEYYTSVKGKRGSVENVRRLRCPVFYAAYRLLPLNTFYYNPHFLSERIVDSYPLTYDALCAIIRDEINRWQFRNDATWLYFGM